MRFNTHDRTPKIKPSKFVERLLIFVCGMLLFSFVFIAIALSVYSHGIEPLFLILAPVGILSALAFIVCKDMDQAYVEIDGDTIRVVDYYFRFKKES